MSNKCAVVIGVSKTGNQVPLQSPVPGAKAVAKLFRNNGYEVELITDEKSPVTVGQIAQAIKKYIDQRPQKDYRLLVLYFSGHGYWKNQSDLWLLSHAPMDADEAISVVECADLAQDSGIQNVVLISDACRITPRGKVAERVRGRMVFPNVDDPAGRSKVDKLMASREGTAAYEATIGSNGPESVFTHCLLKAFRSPDPDMVMSVNENGQAIHVVPNRRLEKYLLREVEEALAAINISLSQKPVVDVVSDENVYLARVAAKSKTPKPQETDSPVVDSTEVDLSPAAIDVVNAFNFNIDHSGRLALPVSGSSAGTAISSTRSLIRHAVEATIQGETLHLQAGQLERVHHSRKRKRETQTRSRESVFLTNLAENFAAGGFGVAAHFADRFDTGTGFTVTGASIEAAFLNCPNVSSSRIDFLESGGRSRIGRIGISLEGGSCATLLLVLKNGRGIPLAVLSGYVGHILIKDGLLQTVSYIPINPNHGRSEHPWRWQAYQENASQLEGLRAIAAAAFAGNHIRFGDGESAAAVAQVLRRSKVIDPMLGLFAAYAYLDADSHGRVNSVYRYMMDDLNASLFDVAMLTKNRSESQPFEVVPVVPFCPILTQGWNYLRSRGIEMPRPLVDAQDALVDGPFTTFKPSQTTKLVYAMSRGELA